MRITIVPLENMLYKIVAASIIRTESICGFSLDTFWKKIPRPKQAEKVLWKLLRRDFEGSTDMVPR